MKVLVVPDVHGSHEWESVKDMPTDSYDFIVLCDKDLSYDQKNTVIATDSKYHQIFGTIDTKQLPADKMHLLDFNKFYKKTMKCINDIKSQQFSHMDYKKEFAMEKLRAAFGEKLVERYYKMFFEE